MSINLEIFATQGSSVTIENISSKKKNNIQQYIYARIDEFIRGLQIDDFVFQSSPNFANLNGQL